MNNFKKKFKLNTETETMVNNSMNCRGVNLSLRLLQDVFHVDR